MSQSPCSSPTGKLNCLLTEEEIEPYVRRKKSTSDSRKKLQGLNDENLLRTSINSRERKRMHDLNDALEELRSVLPYGQEANARKLAKISTIMLATNWIRRLTNENSRLVAEVESLRRPKDPQSTTPSVPFTVSPFVFHCLRQFGQSCSCVNCTTIQPKKEN